MRVFAFGCSYTAYFWPTWADIIGCGREYENWAGTGGGNVFIANRIMHAHLLNSFDENDVILICWSTASREDRSFNGSWKLGGNVYNNGYYDIDFLENHWDDIDGANKTLMSMFYVNELLTRIGCRVIQTSMFGLPNMLDEYERRPIHSSLRSAFARLNNSHSLLLGIDEVEFSKYGKLKPKIKFKRGDVKHDHHPTPLTHLEWVKQHVPDLLTAEGEKLGNDYQSYLIRDNNLSITRDSWMADPRYKVKSNKILGD